MRDRRGNHDRRPPAKETSARAGMCDAHWRERPAGELGFRKRDGNHFSSTRPTTAHARTMMTQVLSCTDIA